MNKTPTGRFILLSRPCGSIRVRVVVEAPPLSLRQASFHINAARRGEETMPQHAHSNANHWADSSVKRSKVTVPPLR